MKFGIRRPSFKKSFSARISIKKRIMPKMPKGYGIFRNPEKSIYNKVYKRTTASIFDIAKSSSKKRNSKKLNEFPDPVYIKCPYCGSENQSDISEIWKYYLIIFSVIAILISIVFYSWFVFLNLITLALILTFLLSPKEKIYCNDCKKKWDN